MAAIIASPPPLPPTAAAPAPSSSSPVPSPPPAILPLSNSSASADSRVSSSSVYGVRVQFHDNKDDSKGERPVLLRVPSAYTWWQFQALLRRTFTVTTPHELECRKENVVTESEFNQWPKHGIMSHIIAVRVSDKVLSVDRISRIDDDVICSPVWESKDIVDKVSCKKVEDQFKIRFVNLPSYVHNTTPEVMENLTNLQNKSIPVRLTVTAPLSLDKLEFRSLELCVQMDERNVLFAPWDPFFSQPHHLQIQFIDSKDSELIMQSLRPWIKAKQIFRVKNVFDDPSPECPETYIKPVASDTFQGFYVYVGLTKLKEEWAYNQYWWPLKPQRMVLNLVFDLDKTLIEAIETKDLGGKEFGDFCINSSKIDYNVRIRGGVAQMLTDLSARFNIWVCTAATTDYATKIVKECQRRKWNGSSDKHHQRIPCSFEIPTHRIISCCDHNGVYAPRTQKDLRLILPYLASNTDQPTSGMCNTVIIVDDRYDVWTQRCQRYVFRVQEPETLLAPATSSMASASIFPASQAVVMPQTNSKLATFAINFWNTVENTEDAMNEYSKAVNSLRQYRQSMEAKKEDDPKALEQLSRSLRSAQHQLAAVHDPVSFIVELKRVVDTAKQQLDRRPTPELSQLAIVQQVKLYSRLIKDREKIIESLSLYEALDRSRYDASAASSRATHTNRFDGEAAGTPPRSPPLSPAASPSSPTHSHNHNSTYTRRSGEDSPPPVSPILASHANGSGDPGSFRLPSSPYDAHYTTPSSPTHSNGQPRSTRPGSPGPAAQSLWSSFTSHRPSSPSSSSTSSLTAAAAESTVSGHKRNHQASRPPTISSSTRPQSPPLPVSRRTPTNHQSASLSSSTTTIIGSQPPPQRSQPAPQPSSRASSSSSTSSSSSPEEKSSKRSRPNPKR